MQDAFAHKGVRAPRTTAEPRRPVLISRRVCGIAVLPGGKALFHLWLELHGGVAVDEDEDAVVGDLGGISIHVEDDGVGGDRRDGTVAQNADALLAFGGLDELAIAFRAAVELISAIAECDAIACAVTERDRSEDGGVAAADDEDVLIGVVGRVVEPVDDL